MENAEVINEAKKVLGIDDMPDIKTADTECIDKILELSQAEEKAAPLADGIRGQIKKILRPFKDTHAKALDDHANNLNKFKHDIVKRMASLNMKFGGLVRYAYGNMEDRIRRCDIEVAALREHIIDLELRIAKGHDVNVVEAEFIEGMKKTLTARAEKIFDDLVARAEAAQAEQAAGKEKTDETAVEEKPNESADAGPHNNVETTH